MNRISRVLLMAGLAAAASFAQGPFGPLTSNAPPDPATVVQNQVQRLTNLLGLTTAQAAQATTIFTNAQNAIAPLQTSRAQAQQALPAAIQSNTTATIDQLSSTIGSVTGQILDIQSKADAAFYAILTADQKTKLGTGFGGVGPGFPGFGPGGPRR